MDYAKDVMVRSCDNMLSKAKTSYVLIDGTSPIDLSKQKIIHLTDKLLQANMAASSGLRETVFSMIFFVKMFIYKILLYYYNNWHR